METHQFSLGQLCSHLVKLSRVLCNPFCSVMEVSPFPQLVAVVGKEKECHSSKLLPQNQSSSKSCHTCQLINRHLRMVQEEEEMGCSHGNGWHGFLLLTFRVALARDWKQQEGIIYVLIFILRLLRTYCTLYRSEACNRRRANVPTNSFQS